MMWVAPIINLVMWVGYLTGTVVLVWGLAPQWGGWNTLTSNSKAGVVLSGAVGACCALGLITTSVVPF